MEKLKSTFLVVFLLGEMFLSCVCGVGANYHGRSLKPVSIRNAPLSTLEEMGIVPHKARNNRRKAVNDKYETVKNLQEFPDSSMQVSTDSPNISDK